ncbi:unnamed protein product [Cuscuta campestris]|uniref:Peroxidase n=1 Tax=Cuscuta campestris TaxID=132261 RepID=A0A484NEQ8_9ASTE|nr:unnamed protein product [Cuscuta campestris]
MSDNSLLMIISCFFAAAAAALLSSSCHGDCLSPQFYDGSCPRALEIVKSVVAKAVFEDPRMAASLLRLHFHDCFVQGCDASMLLDKSGGMRSEKISNPNRNSARGYEVIDEIKEAVERECPRTVSCADILALAARDSVVLAGGPYWEVPLGRRDSRSSSLSGSNHNIPAPTDTFDTILAKFNLQGLGLLDLVALSGSHTIGSARCATFRQRLYNQTGTGQPDPALDESYAAGLRKRCPESGEGDGNLFHLDFFSPATFDNSYFINLLVHTGLLRSDQILAEDEAALRLVEAYAESGEVFFRQFAMSMVKMGNISVLSGSMGEVRRNCRKINH